MLLALLFAVAAPNLSLTLDNDTPRSGALHVARVGRIELRLTLHHPADASSIERPEPDFENRDPHYFDHRPGPNVELRLIRVDAQRRDDVPIRIISSGSSGTADADSTEISIDIIAANRDAKLEAMIDCMTESLPQKPSTKDRAAMRAYFGRGVVDNEPGTYEVTASYRASSWGKGSAAVVAPPLRVVIDDGVDGYQKLCDAMKSREKKPQLH
jgi:hypothetical protein